MVHSKSTNATGQVRVFFDGLPTSFTEGDLLPVLWLTYDKRSRALTFAVSRGSRQMMSVQEVSVQSLVEAMVSKGLACTTPGGHYVVRLPSGSSYREPMTTEANLALMRATFHIGEGYEGLSFPFTASLQVVRTYGECRTPLLGLRFGIKAVKLMLDVYVWNFCLALLHLGALSPMGAPPSGGLCNRGSYRFQVGLPIRPLSEPYRGPWNVA